MTVAQLPAGTRNTMTYAGDGKRRRMEDSEGAHDFMWDQENIRLDLDRASTRAAYTHAPSIYGHLVSQRRSGATSFHHFDALGSTRALTNSGQAATDTRDYRAFGLTNASSGSTVSPFWWVGRLGYYHQPDTADHWLRARTYRPQIGRFLSRDPIRQANPPNGRRASRYTYAANSPVVRVDPSGRQATCGGDWRTTQAAPEPADGTPVPALGSSQEREPIFAPGSCGVRGAFVREVWRRDGTGCRICAPPGWPWGFTGKVRWEKRGNRCCLGQFHNIWTGVYGWRWGRCIEITICGPDVTVALHNVLGEVNDRFRGLGDQQGVLCNRVFPLSAENLLNVLLSPLSWGDELVQIISGALGAWDIRELSTAPVTGRYDETIGLYGKEHGCLMGTRCQRTVRVEHGCYKAWAVNYALFGRLGDLCGQAEWVVGLYVKVFKALAALGKQYTLADVGPALAWAEAGYQSAKAPAPPSQVPGCRECGAVYARPLTLFLNTAQ